MLYPQCQENLAVNSKGETQRSVETVDYQSSAGQSQDQKKPVQVIHQPHASKSNTSGGVLANAAASVATTLQSAKEAMSRE